MTQPFFSIVIPLYNNEAHIARALYSVLAQTTGDFDIIIINDGSTDKGPDVVTTISDPRIQLYSQGNNGVSAARNEGIRNARHDFIAFLDADDEWKPDFLQTICRLIRHHPEAGIYATAYGIVTPEGRMRSPRLLHIPPSPWEGLIPNYFRAALGDPPVWTSACVVPKKVFSEVGAFSVGVRRGQDLDMWGRIALRYPVAYSRQVGATWHRETVHSATKIHVMENFLPFTEIAADAVSHEQIPEYLVPDVNTYAAKLQLLAIKQNILAGNLRNARRLLDRYKTSRFFWKKVFWRFWSLMPFSLTSACYHMAKFILSVYRNHLSRAGLFSHNQYHI
jgi:glycosyltransferase involved in cell wall biosynthesis